MVDRDLTPEEFATALGEMAPQLSKEGLLVSDEAAAKLLSNIVPNVKAIKTSVNKGIKIQGGSLSALLAPFKTFGSGFRTSIKSFGISLQKLKEDFKGTFKKLGEKLNLKKQIGDAFNKRIKSLQDAIKKPFTAIKNTFGKIGNFFGFKTKEQREEEEAKNPAKFIIRYLKKNIEPLLKKLGGVAPDDSGGGLLSLLGKSALLKVLGIGAAVSGLLAYFGYDGTAATGFIETLKQTLIGVFDIGGRFFKNLKSILRRIPGFDMVDDVAKASAALKTARQGAQAAAQGTSAAARGGGSIASTGAASGVGLRPPKVPVAGRVPVPPGSELGIPGPMPKPPTPAPSAPTPATPTQAVKSSRILKILKSPLFQPIVESILGGLDIMRIRSAVNLSEDAKQELIGKRVIQALGSMLGGPTGAILGAKLGAAAGLLGGPAAPATVPIGGIGGAIAGAIGGDMLGRAIFDTIGSEVNGFKTIGAGFYNKRPALETSNMLSVSQFPAEQFNVETGVPLNKFFSLDDVRKHPDEFITKFGRTSGLYNTLQTLDELMAAQEAFKLQDAIRQQQLLDAGLAPFEVNDNSQSNATNINNFSSPSGVSPSAVDPILNPIYTAGFGQVTLT